MSGKMYEISIKNTFLNVSKVYLFDLVRLQRLDLYAMRLN